LIRVDVGRELDQLVPPVYRFALRLTGDRDAAEDLTQDTMLRAWRSPRMPDDPDDARIWLFKIAANLHRDGIRRTRVRRRDLPRHMGPAARPLPDAETLRRELADRALAALDRLPDRQRDVLFLSACEGCTNEQIASVLGITGGAVKSSLALGRRSLRAALELEPSGQEMA
jgi:RNA polymerase sigma-70 factor (ECF subfamily)